MPQITDSKFINFKSTPISRNPFTLLLFIFFLETVYSFTIDWPSPHNTVENDEPNSYMKLQNSLEDLKKIIVQNVNKEEERQLPDEIVRNIKSAEFFEAEQKLQKTTDGVYKYAVHEVFNDKIRNFDLLLRFGDSIHDTWSKYKIYEALFMEMKTYGNTDDEKLFRLCKSIKKEVLDQRTNFTNAKSLYNSAWNLIREDVPNIVAQSIMKGGLVIDLDYEKSFVGKVGMWESVFEKVWNRLPLIDICNRTRQFQKYIDAQVAFEIALFHRLQRLNQLEKTQDAITLARHMKLTMNNSDYHSISEEMRTQHRQIKDKLPRSVKNLVFLSAVCMRNTIYDEYLYSDDSKYDRERRHVYTWRPKGINESMAFKWTVSFVGDHRIRLSNQYGEYICSEYDGSSVKPFDQYRNHVFANKPSGLQSGEEQWDVKVDANEIFLINHRVREYLYADCCNYDGDGDERRRVFTHLSKRPPVDSKWEVTHCSG